MLSLSTKSLAILSAVLMLGVVDASAQSGGGGGRYAPAPRQAAPQQHVHNGSAHSHSDTSQPVPHTAALEGYCPVCLVNMRKWVVGRPEFTVDYDGHQYLFPGAEQQGMFRADPTKYAPVLGGNDIVEFARSGKRLQGNVRHGATYEGRHYFFATASNKQAFTGSPTQYANADLAAGGNCIVCKVKMNHDTVGDPNISVVHNGMRFFFPNDQMRQMFLANPVQFASHANQPNTGAGSGHQPMPQPSGSGSGSH